MRRFSLLLLGLVALTLPSAGLAEQPTKGGAFNAPDTLHVGPDLNNGVPLPVVVGGESSRAVQAGAQNALKRKSSVLKTARAGRQLQSHTPVLGEVRNWVGLDDVVGAFYRKGYTFRGMGDHVEIWVASERRTFAGITSTATDFQDTDCRNGVRTQITDAQVNYLIEQFDDNILPIESEAFSVAPNRDGSHALLGAPFHPGGEGDNTVVLIDNVRDDNFYDLNNTQNFSYIAGFFSSQLNTLFDRNIMSIDAFDWLHRTGATPPHEPVPGNNCTSAPARPFLYEGVFAHEYQHLLEFYADESGESTWLNEGLSDHAQTITGYVDPSTPITQIGFDSHTQCFLGNLGTLTDANPNPRAGGPENSLTRWRDQTEAEILCDYGAAYTMLEYLHGQFGTIFVHALHNGEANGLAGVNEALAETGHAKTNAQELLHNWATMVAVDGLIDDGGRILGPFTESLFTTPTLDATINWDTPHAYDTAGAPSNGSDYVRLRNGTGAYLSGRDINSLSFEGAATLPPRPVAWTVDPNPPFTPADPALYSGAGNNRDEAIVKQVTVPTGAGATLTFDALWNEELGWDFLFAQVSTDGGATYQSLTCTDTTTETNPEALPTAKQNVPGFTGYSGGWRPQTCSLSAYAGQTVHLAFRTFNDPAVLGESAAVPPGAWVDDISVGGTLISNGSSLTGWQSFTQVRPISVADFTVTLLSVDTRKGKITVQRLPLTGDFVVNNPANVQKFIDKNADLVAAIVTYDDPSETSTQYAPYRLTVNGVVQPGGGM